MSTPHRRPTGDAARARSFGRVVDAYDRARPSYPEGALSWMLGARPRSVLELGAGTGQLTAGLLAAGHRVLATDPAEPMLRRLAERHPGAQTALATAEQLPAASGSVEAVVSAQAFHWFDTSATLTEVARVLHPGGTLALVWNERDERVPWVRRLGEIIGDSGQPHHPGTAIDDTGLFEQVESATFRFWQPVTRDSLRDLVASRSNVAVMDEQERERTLARVDELYDGYGRGHDGMLLPYVTRCYRTAGLPWAGPAYDEPEAPAPDDPAEESRPDRVDTDSLLIDFR